MDYKTKLYFCHNNEHLKKSPVATYLKTTHFVNIAVFENTSKDRSYDIRCLFEKFNWDIVRISRFMNFQPLKLTTNPRLISLYFRHS